MTTRKKKDAIWKPRRCKYCKLMFVPMGKNPANVAAQEFCCKNHRTLYHRNGGMNFPRMQEVLERAIKKALLADDKFLETIADKLRVKQPGEPLRVASDAA